MITLRRQLFLTVFCIVSLSVGAESRFSFGPAGSVLREGFTKVTEKDIYTREKGYGFESADGLQASDRGGWKKEELSKERIQQIQKTGGHITGPTRTTSDITCAFVEGRGDNAFICNLPDGKYTVWLIANDALWDAPYFEVRANGVLKLDVRIPRRRHVFMEAFTANSENGKLRLEFKGANGWLISGLVIGEEGKALDKTVSELSRDIFSFTKEESPNWKEIPYVSPNPEPALTALEKERGYTPFVLDYMEEVVPLFRPTREDIKRPLRTFAAPGEFEPASLSLYPLKNLGTVHVDVSDFKSGNNSIGRDNVSMGIVRCVPQRGDGCDYDSSGGRWKITPGMIEPETMRTSTVDKAQCKQWWLTVHVPQNAPPGLYSSTVTVSPEKAPAVKMEWQLLVLPFQLTRLENRHFGTWLDSFPPLCRLDGPESRGRNTASERERITKLEMEDYHAHGMDAPIIDFGSDLKRLKEDSDGNFTFDLSTLREKMDFLKIFGKDAPLVLCCEYFCRAAEYKYASEKESEHVPGTFSPKARAVIVSFVKAVLAEGKKQEWPKILFAPIDEPGNTKTKNRYIFAEHVLDFVHEGGGKTIVTVSPQCILRLGRKRIDVPLYSYSNILLSKVLDDAKHGYPYWYYNNGILYGHRTATSRGKMGFDFLRSGSEAATGWGLAGTSANPLNDFDGTHKDWNVLFPSTGKPIPTIYWEIVREGVDDTRYVAALRKEIKEAKQRGETVKSAHAEKFLDTLLRSDAPQISVPSAFSGLRWGLAREILSLRGDDSFKLPDGEVRHLFPQTVSRGPNLMLNPSFEEPAQANGLPGKPFTVNDQFMGKIENSSGPMLVSTEMPHDGKYSLKLDFSKAKVNEDFGKLSYLCVNVPISREVLEQLRGKRVKAGMWFKLSNGSRVIPRLWVRTFMEDKKYLYFRTPPEISDLVTWNIQETEARIPRDVKSMDLHIFAVVPTDPLVRAKSVAYIDDIFLQVFQDPPLSIAPDLEEYFTGGDIRWTVHLETPAEALSVRLCKGGKVLQETSFRDVKLEAKGLFSSETLQPGVYTLECTSSTAGMSKASAEVVISTSPFSKRNQGK